MGTFEIPERFLRNNTPIDLFEIDGVMVSVCLLPANRAETWAEEARKIDFLNDNMGFLGQRLDKAVEKRAEAETDEEIEACQATVADLVGRIHAMQTDKFKQIKARLIDYDAAFTPELFEKATAAQIVGAYQLLKQYTDPFVVVSALELAAMDDLRETVSSIRTKG